MNQNRSTLQDRNKRKEWKNEFNRSMIKSYNILGDSNQRKRWFEKNQLSLRWFFFDKDYRANFLGPFRIIFFHRFFVKIIYPFLPLSLNWKYYLNRHEGLSEGPSLVIYKETFWNSNLYILYWNSRKRSSCRLILYIVKRKVKIAV